MKALISERLRTPRLIAERLAPEHEPDLARLALDARVYPTLWPSPYPPTEADVHDGLRRQLDLWERHGFGLWLLRDRATGEFVGRGGLEYTDAPGRLSVELAWAIVPERWRQGLATELARAAVRTGFQDLDLMELMTEANIISVFIGIESPNEASLRETRKFQNVRAGGTMLEKVHRIQEAGLEVWSGMILGFDHDDASIFEEQLRFGSSPKRVGNFGPFFSWQFI